MFATALVAWQLVVIRQVVAFTILQYSFSYCQRIEMLFKKFVVISFLFMFQVKIVCKGAEGSLKRSGTL